MRRAFERIGREWTAFFLVPRMNVRSVGLGERAKRALEPLLDLSDIPEEGWTLRYQMSFRSFPDTKVPPRERQVDRAGRLTARREYQNLAKDRTIEIQIVPFASEDRAAVRLAAYPATILRIPFRGNSTVGMRIVDQGKPPALEDALLCENTVRIGEVMYSNRCVGRTMDNRLLLMFFKSRAETWSWDEIGVIANLQAEKAKRHGTEREK